MPKLLKFDEQARRSLEAGVNKLADAVKDAGGESLARFKRPRHVVVVDEIKRGPNGKADYAWAKQLAAERVSAPA